MKGVKRGLINGLIVLACLILIGVIYALPRTRGDKGTKDMFTIKELKVGCADAGVIYRGNKAAVIDTGEDDDFDKLREELDANGIQKLSFLVLTHFDKDHIGSATELLENYEVDTVYLPDYEGSGKRYDKLMETLSWHRGNVIRLREPVTFDWEGVHVELTPAADKEALLAALGKGEEIDNDLSLLCRMTYGERSFLFTGDICSARIAAELDAGRELGCDWMKYPYHGRYEDAQKPLLERAGCEYAVVCCSGKNPMDNATRQLLESRGVSVFETSSADVVTECDGISIRVYND